MNFAEIRFWELLAGGLGVIVAVRWVVQRLHPGGWPWLDRAGLLGLGLFLLGFVSWVTLLNFLVVAIGTYAGLAWILRHQARHARCYLVGLIALQLSPLFVYKYGHFVSTQILRLDAPGLQDLIIPVGISFYTFQKVAFVLDTLHYRRPLPRFLDYMNFAGFFPQIVAGPIERRDDLLPQMERFALRWSPEGLNEGAGWIALGLFFKCCLADNLAASFDGSAQANAYLVWLANVMFGLRIYYDFAGYSLVAFGLARCLGVRLTLNFASPYCATSSIEFWRRWHITLSQWFRDYLYVPMGGGRVRWWAANVFVVFVVSGIWHGAGWNFMLWGAMHGTFLVINRLLGPRVRLPTALAWLLTMAASYAAWLGFYETNAATLSVKLRTLLTPAAYGPSFAREALAHFPTGSLVVLAGLFLLIGIVQVLEWQSVARDEKPYGLLLRPRLLPVLVALTVVLAPSINNTFIYFAF
jgi:D-alanyl-lipoteichoic acid acyltransferase DltB (MBOAT superfamily)